MISTDEVLRQTQKWLEKAVIGLNLCPFAQAVHVKKQIRYVVSAADSVESLFSDVKFELAQFVKAAPEVVETTLLIHPYVLSMFVDYNDFLGVVDQLLVDSQLEGKIQIASFHPYYQFADTQPDDIENFTNRSPFPIIQLLREETVERGLANFENPDSIFEANIETLRELGHGGWKNLMKDTQ